MLLNKSRMVCFHMHTSSAWSWEGVLLYPYGYRSICE